MSSLHGLLLTSATHMAAGTESEQTLFCVQKCAWATGRFLYFRVDRDGHPPGSLTIIIPEGSTAQSAKETEF